MEELRRESCIQGHHRYKNMWNPAVGEVLAYEREPHNAADQYSVVITKGGVEGHLPTKLSKLCSLFCDKVVHLQYLALSLEWEDTLQIYSKTVCKSLAPCYVKIFPIFNFQIATGQPKILEHRKYSDLQYIVQPRLADTPEIRTSTVIWTLHAVPKVSYIY